MALSKIINHGNCVEHLKVEGYKKKVCVMEGQDPKEIVQFALEIREVKRA